MPILLITSKVTFVRTIPGASTVFCQSKFWTSFKNLELDISTFLNLLIFKISY